MKHMIPLNFGGAIFRDRCTCPILDLIIHDGLAYISQSIENIHYIVIFFHLLLGYKIGKSHALVLMKRKT